MNNMQAFLPSVFLVRRRARFILHDRISTNVTIA